MFKEKNLNELNLDKFNENTSLNNNNTTNNCSFKKNCTYEINNNGLNRLNYLDYTFLSHRSSFSLSRSVPLNLNNVKNYLYDLKKTLELNLQLLEKLINKNYNKTDLNVTFDNFKKKIDEKEKIKKKIMDRTSKNLIENQIIEELKRKIEENNDYYQEKIVDFCTNLANKDEYIKNVEKKLSEVEIYIQKSTKNISDSKYEKYKNWKLTNFLDSNNYILKRRELLIKDKKEMEIIVNELKKENEEIKNEKKKNVEIISQFKNLKSYKINEYIKKYQREIIFLGNKIKILKKHFEHLNNEFKYLTLSFKSQNEKEEERIDNYINTSMDNINKDNSILPYDLNKKLNNFMDFSAILNKKEESKNSDLEKSNNKEGNPFENLSQTNIWDISAINKN